MPNRMYVGNIPFSFTSEDLGQLFSEYGKVVYAQIVQDRETGRPRGFGFVEMETADMFRTAMEQAHGREVGGRPLAISEAREREPRPGGPRPSGPRPGPAGERPYATSGGADRSSFGGGGGGRPYSGGGGERSDRAGGGRGDRGDRNDRGGRQGDRGGDRGGRGSWRRDEDSGSRRGGQDWGEGHIDRGERRARFEGLPDDVD